MLFGLLCKIVRLYFIDSNKKNCQQIVMFEKKNKKKKHLIYKVDIKITKYITNQMDFKLETKLEHSSPDFHLVFFKLSPQEDESGN